MTSAFLSLPIYLPGFPIWKGREGRRFIIKVGLVPDLRSDQIRSDEIGGSAAQMRVYVCVCGTASPSGGAAIHRQGVLVPGLRSDQIRMTCCLHTRALRVRLHAHAQQPLSTCLCSYKPLALCCCLQVLTQAAKEANVFINPCFHIQYIYIYLYV